MQPLKTPGRDSWRGNPWEIGEGIRLLENNGYVIRKPSEADLPVVVEIMTGERHGFDIGVRCDVSINGKSVCVAHRFPTDLVLDPDRPDFREQELPRLLGNKLGHFIADSLGEDIARALKPKLDKLVPEKRMTLGEIESFINYALSDPLARVETDDRA